MPKARGVEVPLTPIRGERNNNFNLLRLVFATLVILSHSSELIDGDNRREPMVQVFGTSLTLGLLGVSGFFLLSGFLVVQSWERRPHLIAFLVKRVLRIYPAFVVAFLICMFAVPGLLVDMRSYLAALEPVPIALSLALLLPPPVLYPVFPEPFPDLNGAMWSLLYEFRCYVLVAVFGLAQAIRWRWVWLAITIALGVISCAPDLPEWSAASSETLWIGSIEHFFQLTSLFFVGGCFYLFRQFIPLRDLWVLVAALLAVELLCFESTYHLGLLTGGAYTLFWAAQRQAKFLEPLRRVPDISYGLYLYGWPVQKLLIAKIPGIAPPTLFVLAMLISAACGYLSWQCVERWFLRLKLKETEIPKPSALPAKKTIRASN